MFSEDTLKTTLAQLTNTEQQTMCPKIKLGATKSSVNQRGTKVRKKEIYTT